MAEGADQPHVPGTDGTPGCNLPSSSRTRLNNEDASLELSNVLNILGYGPELRHRRRECYRENDRRYNERWGTDFCHDRIIVGSKAEGLSRCFESDWDILHVFNFAECLEAGCDVNSIPENIPVFRMDTDICYPGHSILLLERGLPLFLLSALQNYGQGKLILSSDALLNIPSITSRILPGPIYNDRAGPSLPLPFGNTTIDTVLALRCHCPSILQRWAARSRHWPPTNVVEKVVSMGAFLTPVGFKESKNKNIEWRICFNTGETELMINLNDTQMKLYVLLKMIAKDVLKPRHKEVTSYMMKNIVLWLAENNHQYKFHERSLFFWLHESLLKLRTALSAKQLPYFMIPERNLMAATGLTDAQQRIWITTLTDMMDECPKLIRRLPKIRQAIISHPDPLRWYNGRRIELEIILLEVIKNATDISDISFGDMFYYVLQNGVMWRAVEIIAEVSEKVRSGGSSETANLFEGLQIMYRFLM
ncbi:uncharacterized protein LOC127866987 isoform X2 [Dreissena polymorpha]|nr:uncharacterized protein LOC127866987 isoform X2 [Dreissena polymorpha]XP_052263849.1 uncharacterized protein LOC127866987 isoform X2 [Dreissena polymorpha]XP_052263850.1 uncharacterized protein LOC127866987 isoform X2 [Dreissena polymorpha]XP_052263851.1 uncharacterized protein LOC127866987 isoform X2 [Dreissena polymorpha]XP_052263852.1 uncharacterized protein LOC127866987 isoform X2 [Dreissena polymorpha]XP_052263853.1 uncharacterized protein LOC127866987 isoform X2 [Dreissena polymorpha]